MKHVIIDTDPGVDDALALLLAFGSAELRVEGLTTVAGNVSLELASRNALKILEYLGVEGVPVSPGAEKPLFRENRDATSIHGRTGLGGVTLPEPSLSLDPRPAIQLILEKAKELGDELTIVPLGPLTNIAAAIMAKPSIIGEVSGFVLMGGAYNLTPYGHGNVTPVAEFNVWHDPEAAKIVFESGIPIKAVGLDVTTDPANRLSTGRFAEIEALGTERAELIASLCRNLVERLGGLSLHDPLTLASVVNPGLVETVPVRVEVETRGEVTLGMTVVDRRQRHRVSGVEANVDTCISVDSKRFLGMFFERVVHGRV